MGGGSFVRADTASSTAAERAGAGRDLRLDFFRGLALVFIFVDHIPSNVVNWITVRNFGLSDATEIFIFISGYSAMLAYGSVMRKKGYWFAAARVLHRCWQLYVAHIVLFVAFIAQIAYVSHRFDNPMFAEEMGVVHFIREPEITMLQALLLKFRPVNLDVLPLYIVLLLLFPLVLWGIERRPGLVLAASVLLYAVTKGLAWNLPAYPEGVWFFNPLAWQLLFVIGAWCGHRHRVPLWPESAGCVLVPAAIAYLLVSLFVVMTWSIPQWSGIVPRWLAGLIYPIDKTNLDILRLLHFAALAVLAVRLVRPTAAFLEWPASRPLILCGQHSLYVFCVGTFLSFVGHFVLVEVNGSIPTQVAVSTGGIAVMVGLAALLTWFRQAERRKA